MADVVTQFTGEMGMSQPMLEQYQTQYAQQGGQPQHQQPQQGEYPGYPDMGQQGGPPQGYPDLHAMSPTEQMAYIQQQEMAMRQPQAPPPPPIVYQQPVQYQTHVEDSDEEGSVDLSKIGMADGQKGMLDTIIGKLKGPLVVMILFIIFSLTPVDSMFRQMLPPQLINNMYYYLAIKGFVVGLIYLACGIIIE